MASSRADILRAYPKAEPIVDGIIDLSKKLGVPDPGWLANLINFESAGTFSTDIRNPTSNATGLIQFMPKTARGMGTTVDELAAMTPMQQWAYVEQYMMRKKKKDKPFDNPTDLYMAVFYPAAIGNPDFQFADWVTASNPGIYTPRDYANYANQRAKLPTGLEIGPKSNVWPAMLGASIVLLGLGIYIYMEEPKWARPLWE